MSQRNEFVILAGQSGVNFGQLCARFGISRKTGYKWKRRYIAGGDKALADSSRRPKSSPRSCPPQVEAAVIRLRQSHPTWGGRKLRRRLQDLKEPLVPSASTCTQILRRAGLLASDEPPSKPWQRFERNQPNDLWQMDFKGHFATQSGVRCNPLTVLDDHSRFNLLLAAKANQTAATVQAELASAFARYGLPDAILCDNAPPWGAAEPVCPYTTFSVWLLRLGIRVLHGRPYHPQTQGKEERFHRTLREELLSQHTWLDLAHCAREFERFRHLYNCLRPHDALMGATPACRYRPSVRALPSALPALEYPADAIVQKVRSNGAFTFRGQTWYVGRAFAELTVGLRPSAQADSQWVVSFAHHTLGLIDLASPRLDKHQLHSIYPSA